MADYTLLLSFNANGGSGAPSIVSRTTSSTGSSVTVTATIPSTRPTRYGYNFGGWSGNGGTYQPSANVSKTFTRQFDDQGNIINQSATIYFSAIWYVQISSWGSTPSSVQLNGTTEYTFNINKLATVDHHTVTFKLGSQTLTYTNVGTSKTVVFPTSWQAQLPNATSGSITCTLTSYNSGGSKLGSTSKTITGNVPSSVVPTLSVTHERINSNSTVAGWGILLQGFSQIKFTATAAGAGGSTISAITFSGSGVQQTGTATTATSSVLNATGSQTWTITAKDSRGRTASTTYTETVYGYTTPSISTASAKRCDSVGTINESTGTYALFNGTYAYSTANGHNVLTQTIDSKLHSGSTWTTRANSYTSGTDAIIGGGSFDADKTYDIRLTITDSLGNSATYSVFLSSVQGFALGLKNDRARFGGVPVRAGLQVDWDVWLGERKILTSLWKGTWSSGDLTVDGISQYTLFIVRMSGQGTQMLVSVYDDGSGIYFRGFGGYSPSSTNEVVYYLNATMSGDTLTMVDCHNTTATGTRSARTVCEIIGVI
mgnify:CR=1 FL=1